MKSIPRFGLKIKSGGRKLFHDYSAKEIESKWQKKWDEEGIFRPEPDSRQKFFLTIPYPYLNGNLHAGHTRTFTIGDVVARYRRMRGENVLFPMAFHATGTPIVGLSELIANRDPLIWNVYTKLHGIPEEELSRLTTPEIIVDYFRKQAKEAMRSIGFSIDWRREFTTTDPAYKKFIEWQFGILKELQYVTKGSHPVRWCPHDGNPVEDHDILKGEEATIMDFALIKFRVGDRILPCATLRPETVFGVTNLWVNPQVEHVLARVNDELWVVSPEAYYKLTFTDRKVEKVGTLPGRELIGQTASNPLTGDLVPILPAEFVDPDNGSGIVMSVPAHAPFDYLALVDLYDQDLSPYGITWDLREIKFTSLISVPGYGEFPAVEAVKELGAVDQHDPRAEEATKMVYRREFHGGVLKENTGKYAGIPVQKIKDLLLRDLIDMGAAEIFYEFSQNPVICRCGTRCVVNMVRDQWFLEYSRPEWKVQVMACLAGMKLIPDEIRTEFVNKVDWLKDKACARRKGLGTRLPWDPQWLIESLADSTIYMAFYILAKYVNQGMEIDHLPPAFFDYIFLGTGDAGSVAAETGITLETVNRIRADFQYWYPVDLRTSGKDLVANHLLFFLFHHVAIFPESLWPKAIAVNGFVSLEGQKMSKSKGPILTLRQAVEENGADVTRLYILANAEHTQDADWRSDGAQASRAQVERFYALAREILTREQGEEGRETTLIDRWILSRLQSRIAETTEALENIQTRRALQSSFYQLANDIRWYERRGGKDQLRRVLEVWVRLMAPFIPHTCEEIWSELGEGYISKASWPLPDPALMDQEAEMGEALLQSTQEDIEEILRVTRTTPRRIVLYTAPEWKRIMVERALEISRGGKMDMALLMKVAMTDPEVQRHKKEAPKFAQKLAKEIHSAGSPASLELDEFQTLAREVDYLSRTFGCPVEVRSADDAGGDPLGKAKVAEPGRAAIYVE